MGRAGESKSRGKGLTYALVIFFCIFAGAFLFLRSSYFDVKEITVLGNVRVPDEEILARAGQTASNIFAFDLDKASRLIETSPWIEKAIAKRQLPDVIVLTVTERVPVAFTPIGDDMWLVDGSGRILGKDDGAWPDLVALTGPLAEASPGQFLDGTSYGWGLRLYAALGPLCREKLTEISVQGQDAVLILDDGCEVLMGSEKEDVASRASVLESILADLAEAGKMAERIDLRFDRPAVLEQY